MITSRARLAGLALVLALAACGGEDTPAGGTDEVASLSEATPTGSGTAPVPATPASQDRPLVRPDASQEEKDRLDAVWFDCLGEHGHPKQRGIPEGERDTAKIEAQAKEAEKACEHLQPESPWQRAERTDPKYGDKLRDWVTCIRSHGINGWEEDGHLMFESLPPEDQLEKVDECEATAFASVLEDA